MAVPREELLNIAAKFRRLAADLEAGNLRSCLFVIAGDQGTDNAGILAPLDQAALMVATLEIALQDAIKSQRIKHTSITEDQLIQPNQEVN